MDQNAPAPSQTAVSLEVCEANLVDAPQRELFTHWQSMCSGGEIPCWRAFDPTASVRALPEIILYDAMRDGGFFVSVIGEDCRNELGTSAMPRPIEDVIPPCTLDDVRSRLAWVRDNEKPHLVRKNRAWKEGAEREEKEQEYTVLFLPFRFRQHGLSHKIINVLSF